MHGVTYIESIYEIVSLEDATVQQDTMSEQSTYVTREIVNYNKETQAYEMTADLSAEVQRSIKNRISAEQQQKFDEFIKTHHINTGG